MNDKPDKNNILMATGSHTQSYILRREQFLRQQRQMQCAPLLAATKDNAIVRHFVDAYCAQQIITYEELLCQIIIRLATSEKDWQEKAIEFMRLSTISQTPIKT